MIPTLYEPFRHWSEGGSVFILSDMHFDDDDCKLMDPDWISPEEQISIINKSVAKGDTFVCLGDVGMDVIIKSSGAMREAINTVGDRLGLPVGWLNTDFVNTNSYTPRLAEHSKYYKTFSNILQIRTVYAEYLVAMKLMAGRQYKNDLSDIVGVLIEQEERDEPLSFEKSRSL